MPYDPLRFAVDARIEGHWLDFFLPWSNGNLRFSIYHRGWAPVEKVVLRLEFCYLSFQRLNVSLSIVQLEIRHKWWVLHGFAPIWVWVTYVLSVCWSREYDMCHVWWRKARLRRLGLSMLLKVCADGADKKDNLCAYRVCKVHWGIGIHFYIYFLYRLH